MPSKLSVPSLSISHLYLSVRKTGRRGFVRRALMNMLMGTCLPQSEQPQVHPIQICKSESEGVSSSAGTTSRFVYRLSHRGPRILSSASVAPKLIVRLLSRDLPRTLHAELSGESHGTSRIGSHHTGKPFRSQSDRHLVHPSGCCEGFALSFLGKRGGSRSH